jgi:hypothetical protein
MSFFSSVKLSSENRYTRLYALEVRNRPMVYTFEGEGEGGGGE